MGWYLATTQADGFAGNEAIYVLPANLFLSPLTPTMHHSSISSVGTSQPSILSAMSQSSSFSTVSSTSEIDPLFDPKPFFRGSGTSKTVALLGDLKDALEYSNLSEGWQDMAGVLLWIGLTAGAASSMSESKGLRNYFAALTVRSSMLLCFDHPQAIHATYVKMAQIVDALSENDGS